MRSHYIWSRLPQKKTLSRRNSYKPSTWIHRHRWGTQTISADATRTDLHTRNHITGRQISDTWHWIRPRCRKPAPSDHWHSPWRPPRHRQVQAAPSIKSLVPKPRWHGRSQSIWLHSLPSHNLYTQERSTQAQSSATTAMAECCFRPMGPPSHWWTCPSSCRRVHKISRNSILPQYQCWCCSAPPRQDLLDTRLPRTAENRWWPSIQWNWFLWISNVHEMGRDQDPEANVLAENFMKMVKKVWHTTQIEKKNFQQEISNTYGIIDQRHIRPRAAHPQSCCSTEKCARDCHPFRSRHMTLRYNCTIHWQKQPIQGCQIQRQTTWHPARRSSPPPSKRL